MSTSTHATGALAGVSCMSALHSHVGAIVISIFAAFTLANIALMVINH